MGEPVAVGGWYLYRFWPKAHVRCAVDGCRLRHPLYIGKTNEPWRRHGQHLDGQPWIPLAAGYTIQEGYYATNEAVLAAERTAILAELPLANDQHNRANPHRLVFDRPVARPQVARAPRKVTKQAVALTRQQKRTAWTTAGWVALTAALWWGAVLIGVAGRLGLFAALAVVLVLLLGGWVVSLPKRAWARRRLAGLVMVAASLFVVWTLGVTFKGHLPSLPAAPAVSVPR